MKTLKKYIYITIIVKKPWKGVGQGKHKQQRALTAGSRGAVTDCGTISQ